MEGIGGGGGWRVGMAEGPCNPCHISSATYRNKEAEEIARLQETIFIGEKYFPRWCSGFCQNQDDLLFLQISALVGISWKLELNRICISIVHKVHTPSGCSPIRKLSLFYHNWNFAPSAGEQSVGSEISFFGCSPSPGCTQTNHHPGKVPLTTTTTRYTRYTPSLTTTKNSSYTTSQPPASICKNICSLEMTASPPPLFRN